MWIYKSNERLKNNIREAGGSLITKAYTVADNVRQGFDWCWITGVLSIGDKAERSRRAYFIGHDPVREQMRHPTMGRLDEGI